MDTTPKFSILTPVKDNLRWIKSCVASVADQDVDGVEHVVQDGASTDGTAEWLAGQHGVNFESRPDAGIYDAVNRAYERSQGSILLHLNADEQLLPGALRLVASLLEQEPRADVLLFGALVVGDQGHAVCRRPSLRPWPLFVRLDHLPVFTGATFLRRSAIQSRLRLYDDRYRAVADAALFLDFLKDGIQMVARDQLTTIFVDDGNNFSLSRQAKAERQEMAAGCSAWIRAAAPMVTVAHRLRKVLRGHYRKVAIEYALYLPGFETQRVTLRAEAVGGAWLNRLERTASGDIR